MTRSRKGVCRKQEYMSPSLDVSEFKLEGLICQSPGGGGSEGTGDEPLYAPILNDYIF